MKNLKINNKNQQKKLAYFKNLHLSIYYLK